MARRLLLPTQQEIDRARAERIARGSGCSLMEIGLLLQSHQKMAQMVGNLGKNKLISKVGAPLRGCDACSVHVCQCVGACRGESTFSAQTQSFLHTQSDMSDAKLREQMKRNPGVRCGSVGCTCNATMDAHSAETRRGRRRMMMMANDVGGVGGGCGDGTLAWQFKRASAHAHAHTPLAYHTPALCHSPGGHAEARQEHGPQDAAEHRRPAEHAQNDAVHDWRRWRRRPRRDDAGKSCLFF
jgi:hypothetical protein